MSILDWLRIKHPILDTEYAVVILPFFALVRDRLPLDSLLADPVCNQMQIDLVPPTRYRF